MPITRAPFGQTPGGEAVELFTLRNANGLEARVTNYGATLVALLAPDRDGQLADMVLGFDSLEGYLNNQPFFGSIVGRYANRIARGRFELDGVAYSLPINNGPNHLHGGPEGFHTRVWQAVVTGEILGLSYVSPDGEAGYPGRLTVAVTYSLSDNNELRIGYAARAAAPTVLNLTNHAYFNLAGSGAGDILDHELQISADQFLPVDATQIPTGELHAVAGTAFDLRDPVAIGPAIAADDEQLRGANGGFDHCWVFGHNGDLGVCVARVRDPRSGRLLELFTTQPGVQCYTGNFLEETPLPGKGGWVAPKYGAFCLETQHFPDAPNQPTFPTTVLRPGEQFRQTTIYRFSVE
jgi:aldose 1-epimerase